MSLVLTSASASTSVAGQGGLDGVISGELNARGMA